MQNGCVGREKRPEWENLNEMEQTNEKKLNKMA